MPNWHAHDLLTLSVSEDFGVDALGKQLQQEKLNCITFNAVTYTMLHVKMSSQLSL